MKTNRLTKLFFKSTIKGFSILVLLNISITPNIYAQCSAIAGGLGGNGIYCIGDPVNIGIPLTKRNQTYTWIQDGSKIVKGPVAGNGNAISYNFRMSAGDSGHYTVLTEKEGCTSTEFGDVTVKYTPAPSGVTTTSVYFDSVAFKWNSVADAFGYEFAVDNDSKPPFSGIFTSDTFASKNSLTPFIDYYIHVRALVFDGQDCAWSTVKFRAIAATGPGSLDKSFNKSGKIITRISGYARAYAEVIQPDGKIVVVGTSYNYFGDAYLDFTIVRYTADGKPDKSFGNKGKAVTDVGEEDVGTAVAVQTDGKIILAGYSYNGSGYDFALVRYNTNGSLDNTFGTGGKVFTDFNLHDDFANSIAIQQDGKIIVAGSSQNGFATDFALVRFNTNGSLDLTFGAGGKIITDYGGDASANSIAIQTDKKIVVAGSASGDFLLTRFNVNGAPDSSFGTNGKVFTDFNNNGGSAHSVAIRANGTILVAGTSNAAFALAKYKTTGILDSTFDFDGKVITPVGNDSYASSLVLPPNGKIIVAGYSYSHTYNDLRDASDFTLIRYILNGRLDSTFGYGGIVITDFGATEDFGYSAALQQDGKILVAGYTTNYEEEVKIAVARYNTDSVQTAKVSSQNYPVAKIEKLKTQPVSHIFLSPNPVKDVLHIAGLNSFNNTTIYISDITGRVLKKYESSGNSYSCNVKQLTAGIYYLVLEENKVLIYIKFIKE